MSHFPEPIGTPVKRRREKSAVRELVEIVVGALILAALIMGFVARSFIVDGPSMEPTLESGERLLVDQLTYRFREPKRGEIVIFRNPGNTSETYIKRVIGLPGDVVSVRNGVLSVNGQVIEEPYIKERMHVNYGPSTVPEGHYFVMGDHRNNSLDSRRREVGPVPRDHIIGRALVRFWPLTSLGTVGGEAGMWSDLELEGAL